jgi:hypothetical protein
VNRLVLLRGLDDALEVFWSFGPGEGTALGVVAGEEPLKEFFQIVLRSLHTVRQPLLAEDAEEAFDQIHPGSMGWRVMELDSWVTLEPAAGDLIFMDVQIIRYDMKFPIGIGPYDVIHEAEEVGGRLSRTSTSLTCWERLRTKAGAALIGRHSASRHYLCRDHGPALA